jgi:hypothetical protein
MHALRRTHVARAVFAASVAACGGSVVGSGSDSGVPNETSGEASSVRDGSDVQVDGGDNADVTEDYIVVTKPDGWGMSDGFVPSCNIGGSSTCDVCLSNSCCLQVEACQVDPTCMSAMACLVKCEENGGSGLACAEGQCSKPADQQTTNLFTCGSQQCATPCYMN